MHLIFKRVLAWLIDWVVIVLYAAALFGVTVSLSSFGVIALEQVHPLKGQLIGFLTLTFPVLLYCIILEAGGRHATIGKRIMKIEVTAASVTTRNIVIRNLVKFVPWECAHAGVLWINYINTAETPLWIWILLIVPQLLMILYFMTAVATKGSRSVYDFLAGTRVRHVVNHLPVVVACILVL